MARCEVCGNQYDKAFQVRMGGKEHTFDSFECAIEALAPRCAHCQCRIIGHGMEQGSRMFCCAHCAAKSGAPEMKDRVHAP
jgi:phage terminase large subunit GpA-like protein